MHLVTWSKRLVLTLLTTGLSAVIAACYGVYSGDEPGLDDDDDTYDPHAGEDLMFSGTTHYGDNYVSGLEVCATVTGNGGSEVCVPTINEGEYQIWAEPRLWDDVWERGAVLSIHDEDGEMWGHFADDSVDVEPESIPLEHEFLLDLFEEE